MAKETGTEFLAPNKPNVDWLDSSTNTGQTILPSTDDRDASAIDTQSTPKVKDYNASGFMDSATARDEHFEKYVNKIQHKSFDFSNVGVMKDELRKFHQMRLYIKTSNIFSHAGAQILDTAVITSNLPEQVQYAISSEWSNPLSFGNNGLTNLIMQLGGDLISDNLQSGVNRATTFKIWNNTKPLTLRLRIPVIDDTDDAGQTVAGGLNTNLVEALEYLGSVILPRNDTGDKYGFYVPPPSPFGLYLRYATEWDKQKNQAVEESIKNRGIATTYGRIMLQLGGILLVDNCIVESLQVNYPNTKTMIRHHYASETFGKTGNDYLHPLLATIDLQISTIEALTADTYSKMLWARSQRNAGAATMDASKGWIGKTITGGIKMLNWNEPKTEVTNATNK